MGMQHTVEFGSTTIPAWPTVAALLAEQGMYVDVRMIDGQLSFPDELPPDTWTELRIGAPGGMITVRRIGMAVSLVTWENADIAMRRAWNALTWAFAQAGNGKIADAAGTQSAAEFRLRADI